MSEENKYLKLARAARDESNSEDAKKFYDMARIEEPENGEAKFFYQFYSLYEGKNSEINDRFKKLSIVLKTSIQYVAQSEDSEVEKLKTVESIIDAYTPLTWALNQYMNTLKVPSGQGGSTRVFPPAEIRLICITGVHGLYDLGDAVAESFKASPAAMQLALIPWKEGVRLQRKWYALKCEKTPEEYFAKIQKIDPSYQMPKKGGCITFGDKNVY